MEEIIVSTKSRTDFIDCTRQIEDVIQGWGVDNGVVTVFVPHTTAGITINENADPDVMDDIERVLDEVVPWTGPYRHAEGNTAAHVKASMMGSSLQLIVEKGRLRKGVWQGVYFCEFDGPRTRKLWIQKT